MKKILVKVSDEFYDHITSNSTAIQAEGHIAENVILNGKVVEEKNIDWPKIVKWLLIIVFLEIILAIGVMIGHWQNDEWSVTKIHHELEQEGYQFCPYCGECFKNDSPSDYYVTETTVICEER